MIPFNPALEGPFEGPLQGFGPPPRPIWGLGGVPPPLGPGLPGALPPGPLPTGHPPI